jgi:hypothetical protein
MKIFNFFLLLTFSSIFATAQELTLTPGPLTCEYKSKDLNEEYDENSDTVITCSGSSCSVDNGEVDVSDSIVSINSNGTYILQGDFDGQIRVNVTENDDVHLILNNINIESSDGPAVYVTEADKITITLVGENTLMDSTNYSDVVDEEPDACLFVDSDLSINGPGTLTVTGKYGDAIRCKKDLKIVSGNIMVPNAVQRGIKAKNSICIKDGTIDVNSTNSGIKVTRDDDASKGYIVVDGGSIVVSTDNDGIHAETHLTIRGGYIDVKKSKEGIEGQMIDILGGEIHILASDDGINASKISNSTETETTNNDNNKANGMDGNMSETGTDGSVYINIVGGKTYVTVDGNDVDGIDSNGVLYIGGEAEVYTSINGGNIYGNMAALDAEGSNAIVEGATVIATAGEMGMEGNMEGKMGDKMGEKMNDVNDDMNSNNDNNNSNNKSKRNEPQNENKNEAMLNNANIMKNEKMNNDKMNDGNMNGAMLNNTMTDGNMNNNNMNGMGDMNESGCISQPYIKTSVSSQDANTQITIKDSKDNVIASYTPSVSYSSILISSPAMVSGETYTIIAGENSITATAYEICTDSIKTPSVTLPTD